MHPNEVQTRDDLALFVKALGDEYARSGGEWENDSLGNYLEALSAWIKDSAPYVENNDIDIKQMNWRFVAEMLRAATMYE